VTHFTAAVLPDAAADMREAFLWYFERSPLAADTFGTEMSDAIDGLQKTAGDWPEDEDGVHFYHLKHFPYT
jgi:plasmid stabilization system protein ParE